MIALIRTFLARRAAKALSQRGKDQQRAKVIATTNQLRRELGMQEWRG